MATLSIDCPLMVPGEYDDETELRRDKPGRIVRSWPELAWIDEAGSHRCVVTGRTTLGSAPDTQVRITDREVSRLHAELEPTDRGTWVRDLGSRNGTFVENLQVAAAMLPDGARIRVGSTDVVLRYPREASPVELPAVSPAGAEISEVALNQPFKEFRERWIDQGEREYLQRLLERHGRNVPAAAEEAGLDRTYVYRLIRKHGL